MSDQPSSSTPAAEKPPVPAAAPKARELSLSERIVESLNDLMHEENHRPTPKK